MKILKIQFPASSKVYSYLLDLKTTIIPKAGDILQRTDGCYGKRTYTTKLKVVDVQEVSALPKIVTSVIKIQDLKLNCLISRLNTGVISPSSDSSSSAKAEGKGDEQKKSLSPEDFYKAFYQAVIMKYHRK